METITLTMTKEAARNLVDVLKYAQPHLNAVMALFPNSGEINKAKVFGQLMTSREVEIILEAQLNNKQTVIKGLVRSTVISTGKVMQVGKFDSEREAQDYFDKITEFGSVHSGEIKWDMIAIVDGIEYCRRTKFTNLKG
jgi:hypothetical protein